MTINPARLHVALIGDVGWSGLYHLGDEAMTEAALAELRKRGITRITIIAAEAEAAQSRYGVNAINRFGFGSRWSMTRLERRFDLLCSEIPNEFGALDDDDPAHAIFQLVRECDAVLIAGGGNLTSRYPYHVYERSLLTKLAIHFRKPLVLTSQTFGPELSGRHRSLLAEMLDYASAVGAREYSSVELAGKIASDQDRIDSVIDDAFLLVPTEDDNEWVDYLALAPDFALATVSPYITNPFYSEDAYFALIASSLDALSEELDVDVYLAPHVASPKSEQPKHDQLSHAALFDQCQSNRVRELPMMTASQYLAILKRARFAISTRYHPIVFGHRVGVPTISIGIDPYSYVRMHGAQSNFGTETLHLPALRMSPTEITSLAKAALKNREGYAIHVRHLAQEREQEAHEWWDKVVRELSGFHQCEATAFMQAEPLAFEAVDAVNNREFEAHNLASNLHLELRSARASRESLDSRLEQCNSMRQSQSRELEQTKAELARYEEMLRVANGRKAVRFADFFGDSIRKLMRK